ncbi:hypothetical protein JTM16_33280, partial [Pseudomonas aeruginosa]|nr:hypothetical protein [Pseudomonas aeruginosa]
MNLSSSAIFTTYPLCPCLPLSAHFRYQLLDGAFSPPLQGFSQLGDFLRRGDATPEPVPGLACQHVLAVGLIRQGSP